MSGWTKSHRSIMKHWIHEDPIKYRAWEDMIKLANIEDKKVAIGNDLYVCKRGEMMYSLESLCELLGIKYWNKSKLRRFLIMLKNDTMIELKPNHKTTHLSIVNYGTYQGDRNAAETQTKRKRNASETQVNTTKEEENLRIKELNNQEEETAADKNQHPLISFINENFIHVLTIENQLTEKQAENITGKYEKQTIADMLNIMERQIPKLSKAKLWSTVNLTLHNLCNREEKKNTYIPIRNNLLEYFKEITGKIDTDPNGTVLKNISDNIKKGISEEQMKKAIKNKFMNWSPDKKMHPNIKLSIILGSRVQEYANETTEPTNKNGFHKVNDKHISEEFRLNEAEELKRQEEHEKGTYHFDENGVLK